MNIYLTDQEKKFEILLKQLSSRSVITFDKRKLKERTTSIDLGSEKKLEQLDLNFFFDYKIFPSRILTFMAEWKIENRSIRVGDTILQQVFIPPTRVFSQKIVFGVRISSIIDETGRKGFSYVTIEGHVERGESVFTFEKAEGRLIFKITTFSEPGNVLTSLLGPIFTDPYQAYCTRAALENVRRQILG
jgi:hypothetical protein